MERNHFINERMRNLLFNKKNTDDSCYKARQSSAKLAENDQVTDQHRTGQIIVDLDETKLQVLMKKKSIVC